MKLTYLLLPIVISLTACAPSKKGAAQSKSPDRPPADFSVVSGEAGADDIGRFLAGLPIRHGAALSRLQQTEAYQLHQREMGKLGRNTVGMRMDLMATWSKAAVAPVIGSGGTVNYPFGGPDLLHVSAVFPQASTYALMGLESVGAVPPLESLPPDEVLAALASFRQTTQTQLRVGYFVTDDMRSTLERGALRGVTPILLSTVAMMGGKVKSATSISAGGNPGVELQYDDAGGKRHTALYVAGDLSNRGFGGGYRQWVASLGGKTTYFKAASYLMHDGNFSQAREFFLSQSRVILQDDSGIPFRYFAQDQWTFRFYGDYQSPIPLFAKHRQEDLRQAFETHPKGPLGFGSGYHASYSNANLLLAIKR